MPSKVKGLLSFTSCPDWLWCLLFKEYCGSYRNSNVAGVGIDHSHPSSTEFEMYGALLLFHLFTWGGESQNMQTGKFNINVLNNSISVQLFTSIVLCISGNSGYIMLLF